MTNAKLTEGSSKNENRAVIITADTKVEAQAAIRTAGRFHPGLHYSSNLDMFYRTQCEAA